MKEEVTVKGRVSRVNQMNGGVQFDVIDDSEYPPTRCECKCYNRTNESEAVFAATLNIGDRVLCQGFRLSKNKYYRYGEWTDPETNILYEFTKTYIVITEFQEE